MILELILATNIVLVIGDDLGMEVLEDRLPSRTPTLDQMAVDGCSFTNFYTNPTCSPTRCALLTGRHAWRHGIGSNPGPNDRVAFSEETLAELLGSAGYATAYIGKWHIGHGGSPWLDPVIQGWHHFLGWGNNPGGYTDVEETLVTPWAEIPYPVTGYSTTLLTDQALQAISVLPEPWCVVLAYNAPHQPYHEPPQGLYTGSPPTTDQERYVCMVEALDTEFGRLLGALDLTDTVAVFLGDNGCPVDVSSSSARAKGSLYQDGLRCPLLAVGAGIQRGRVVPRMIGAVDVLPTLCDLAGAVWEPAQVDGRSFVACLTEPVIPSPARPEMVYAERFKPNQAPHTLFDQRAGTDGRWKLIRDRLNRVDEFYDLSVDPGESAPIDTGTLTAEQQAAFDALSVFVDNGGV